MRNVVCMMFHRTGRERERGISISFNWGRVDCRLHFVPCAKLTNGSHGMLSPVRGVECSWSYNNYFEEKPRGKKKENPTLGR